MFKSSKIITIISTVFVSAMLSLPALAQAKTTAQHSNAAPSVHLHMLRLGYMHTHQNYAEHPSKPYDDTVTGSQPGGYIGYENFSDHFFMDWATSISSGNAHYDGYIHNQITGTNTSATANATQKLIETHIHLGPAIYLGNKRNIIAPYIGLSTRLSQGTVGPNTPSRIRTRRVGLFGDFGLVYRLAITHRLQAQLKAGGQYLATGYVRNSLGYSTRYTGHTMSYKASAEIDYRIWHFIGVFAKVSFNKVKLPKTYYNSTAYEPEVRDYVQHYIVGLDLGHF